MQTSIILLYFFIFLIYAFANVFMIDLHQKGMVRITGRMRMTGFCAALLAFFLAVILTRDALLSLLLAGVFSLVTYVFWIWIYRERFGPIRIKPDISAIKRLVVTVAPILVITFIQTYLSNAPKLLLGEFNTYETVAVFSFLIFPALLYQMVLNMMLFGAPLPQVSEDYANGQFRRFSKRIHTQLLIVAVVFIPFLAFTYFFGIPLLSWLYDTDLASYKRQLMLLSAGGFFITAGPYIGMLLIIMRKQKAYLYSFIAVGAVSGSILGFLIWQFGIDGAALSNLVVFAPLTVLVYVVFRRTLYHEIE